MAARTGVVTSRSGEEHDLALPEDGCDAWASERDLSLDLGVGEANPRRSTERTGNVRKMGATGDGMVGEQYVSLVDVSLELLNLEANGEAAMRGQRRDSEGDDVGYPPTSWIRDEQANEAHWR